MNNKVIIQFINEGAKQNVELEIPINITANDLIIALNEAFVANTLSYMRQRKSSVENKDAEATATIQEK